MSTRSNTDLGGPHGRTFPTSARLPVLLLAAGLLLMPGVPAAQPPPKGAAGPPPATVQVDKVTRQSVREGATLVGTAESFQTSTVASVVAARAVELLVRTGDRVQQGAPLLKLDTTLTDIGLRQARARAEAARVGLSQDESDLKVALALLPQEAVSTDLVAARQRNVARAQQELAESETEVERLTYLMEQSTVRAPFSGVVAAELAQAGEWVPAGGGIVRLVEMGRIRVRVWVPEHIVGRIRVGDKVPVSTEGGEFSGTVQAVIPEGDPKSRTFPVEVAVSNKGGKLFAGMLASVTFGVGNSEPALTVPRDAVVTSGSGSLVWKVVDGAAVRVPVTPGRDGSGGRVEVRPMGELKEGDTVITRGNERVRDGQAVAAPR
ncbi:MAG: efflux RND transporter periplasmic adaptor subunit [Nitrospirota bacterium]|nr:efflux RND transporter periplasmic adaptor subunit [Nitrospirota bacterium]